MAVKQTTKRTSKKIATTKKSATTKRSAGPKTTQRSAGKKPASNADESGFFGLPLRGWVASAKSGGASEARSGGASQVFVFTNRDRKALRSAVRGSLLPWQLENAEKSEAEIVTYAGKTGPIFILRPPANDTLQIGSHEGKLDKSSAARVRDQVGSILPQVVSWKSAKLAIHFFETTAAEEQAALLGLELASYSYSENRANPRKPRKKLPSLLLIGSQLESDEIRAGADLGVAINLSRHLTNLPGGDLNPATYAQAVQKLFAGQSSVKVDVWDADRLREERCNLMLAVGGGAAELPRLIHIRYRPQGSSGKRPLAFVGKGITFDSGGLDIKPSAGMRWMKKDMGGSAAVVGLAFWAMRAGVEQPLDLYLAVAENAVSGNSFRPGDIITARNGMTIEIHNTDAEGRLVLADALDVAVTQEGADAPLAVINLATLTGAIKVALGGDIAGLFSNHDELSDLLEQSAMAGGELVWRMPLFQPYKSSMRSTFSDMANASDGFGGAITAALFLQQFVGKTPWAHLDIYAWKDSASGAWTESGGSGQGVQMLSQLLLGWDELSSGD